VSFLQIVPPSNCEGSAATVLGWAELKSKSPALLNSGSRCPLQRQRLLSQLGQHRPSLFKQAWKGAPASTSLWSTQSHTSGLTMNTPKSHSSESNPSSAESNSPLTTLDIENFSISTSPSVRTIRLFIKHYNERLPLPHNSPTRMRKPHLHRWKKF